MRVKTDERRRAIMDAATELFHEVGYERASMAGISARVGGSKQTLYSYFKSKEELFAAAMVASMEERGYQLIDLLDPATTDLRATLERFGTAYLDFIADPELVRNNRVAIGAAGGLGAQLYQLGPRRLWGEITGYLQTRIDAGQLTAPSATIAGLHLQGLLEAGYAEALLFGAPAEIDKAKAVAAGIDVFFKAYGA
ncbi:MAG: TetR/AcrR family transcriptional regulator [Sphingomonas taxi]